ncbi:aspartate kinase [Flavobacterium ponti]|jgi:hypothetical protein|uniref:Aspartate kinase n=1 Tax=Flavobacterium ponti TaxID=665133 RepID=A0ABV9P333_9FLAO
MKTVSSFVEHYLKTKPFLLGSLSEGIINLTSLARIMMPEVEKQLGKDIKQGAVVMSLKRLTEELDFKINHRISKVIRNIGEITVRSSLNDYTYMLSDTLLSKQAELISTINLRKDVFYTSSRGVNEINIVLSDTMDSVMEELFKAEKQIQKINDLSSITIKLPHENVNVPGVYYYIFQRLAWEGIVLYEVISTSNEFTFLVSEQQVDIAFRVIKDLKNV